jgi:hypothetical protein
MNGKPGPGGYSNPVREAWALRFGIHPTKLCVLLNDAMCKQLAGCKDDMARRLILGVKP